MNDTTQYIILGAMILWLAYAKGWILAKFKSITAVEAIDIIKNNKTITILDVRTNAEYKSSHLQNAISIPLSELSTNLSKLDKNKEIIVYCLSGGRSVSASRILEKNGYAPLNVSGGIGALKRNGAKTV
jgi:rhodanese-related sulfurtransferase